MASIKYFRILHFHFSTATCTRTSKNSNKIEITIPKHIGAKDPDWDVVICDEADYLFE